MTNTKTTEFEKFRARVWVQTVLACYGRGGPDHLETWLRARGRPEWDAKESAGRFAAYAKGSKPFRSRQPIPDDATWVDACAELWPCTGSWFYTPMWYLLDNRVPLPTLYSFVRQLPVCYQDTLLAIDDPDDEDLHFALEVVRWPFLADLSYPLGPWSLGALACAMRRLDLAGDVPGARKCAVGLVWSMNELAATFPSDAAKVIRECAAHLRSQLAIPNYLAKIGLTVTDAELDSFAIGRSQHLNRYRFPKPTAALWSAGWGQSCTSPYAMFRCPYRC